MKRPLLTVKEIVRITGMTTRSLHFYDKIGLFKPAQLTDKGYRLYDRSSLEKLQTILILKEMDFSLKEIADIVKLTREEQKQVLQEHRQTLSAKKQRLENIMTALDEYVLGSDVSTLHIFDHSSILPLKEQYANEAELIYGETEAFQAYDEAMANMSAEDKERTFSDFEEIFKRIVSCMGQEPSSAEVQQLIEEWKSILVQFMPCDAELLACIAHNYTYDARFNSYFNQFHEGAADFLYSAIMYNIRGANGS
ncbi:MerR family transcriptional regulator [Paenibacillus sp. FSL K6-1096]|uniref:MerR family transcriptional regulator n=1 Tax=Paenibacillus sp. FSL K6-1096 TaxID=2921460 RepID=UPI0030ED61F3